MKPKVWIFFRGTKSLMLAAIFLSLTTSLLGHQDRYYIFEIDEVVVRIQTGYNYEEVKKAELLSRMINDLVNKIGYCKGVQLDIIHDYTNSYNESISFVSVGKPKMLTKYGKSYLSKVIGGSKLVIRTISSSLNFKKICEVVSASCGNIKYIKKNQEKFHFKGGYYDFILYGLNQKKLSGLVDCDPGNYIEEVMSAVYFRRGMFDGSSIKYYTRDNSFFFVDTLSGNDQVIHQTDDLYQCFTFNTSLVVVNEPCDIVLLDKNNVLLEQLPYCDGIWRLIEIEDCSDQYFKLNYYSSNWDTVNFIFKLQEVMFNSITGSQVENKNCID